MKKIVATAALAACSTLALSGAAHAQTNVTMYGLLDAAVDYNTNADATGRSRVWMPSLGGGMFPSRIGFRGTEDLGGGLKAIFNLETGVYTDTGGTGQGNRLFGRQAWVGLAGNWGQLTLGRNYNMLYNSMPEVEIIGPTQYGLGSLDAGIPNGREDNSVAYKGSFNKFTVGATYSLGRDTSSAGGPGGTNCPGEAAADARPAANGRRCCATTPAAGALPAPTCARKGGATAAFGLNRSDLTDSRAHVAGYTKFGAWRLATGAVIRDNEGSATTPRSNLYYVDGAFKATPVVTVDGLIARLDYRNSGNDTKMYMLRAIYDFSKRTSTYVAIGHVSNDGTAAVALSAGGSPSARAWRRMV
jgi:predicted porin